MWDLFKMAPCGDLKLPADGINDEEVPLVLFNSHHIIHISLKPLLKIRKADTKKDILHPEQEGLVLDVVQQHGNGVPWQIEKLMGTALVTLCRMKEAVTPLCKVATTSHLPNHIVAKTLSM